MRDEAGAAVEVDHVEEAVAADGPVEPPQEEAGALRRTDDDVKPLPARVVEVEQRYPLGARLPGAEVLSVARRHLHAVWVLERPRDAPVGLLLPPRADAHPAGRAPDGHAIDHLVGGEDPVTAGAPDDLGEARLGICPLLRDQERDELRRQHVGRAVASRTMGSSPWIPPDRHRASQR
jgi:hypothetical protein